MPNKIKSIGIEVIDLQIKALKKLKNSIGKSFNEAVKAIVSCKSKVIICGVGKSGKIASKISATLSSVGSPSFSISANECSHGDLGRISNQDLLILISYSGNTRELMDLIKFAKLNRIKLIGMVSNKNSYLYKKADIKLLLPSVIESGLGIVPTSSTTSQLSLGDSLAVASMMQKKFGKMDFKKFHPAGNLGLKLKTASDVMLIKNKIPFVYDNTIMSDALKVLNTKKLGFLVVIDKNKLLVGVLTDGDLKRIIRKKKSIYNMMIKKLMTRKPYSVEENTLVTDVIKFMNQKKITNICVYNKINKKKITGVIHIHNLINLIK